jgi:hypothetical protein
VQARTEATRQEFEAQKADQRTRTIQGLREQRVRSHLDNLRRAAKIDDYRQVINARARRQTAALVQ